MTSPPPLSLLAQRCAQVPDELARALDAPLPRLAPRGRGRWVITGVGASEGPARLLAALLRERVGLCAAFAPLSAFAGREPDEARAAASGRDEVLVVFSQGLSPNARLALAHRRAFAATLLVTSRRSAEAVDGGELASLEREGVVAVSHGPREEAGLLLRVVGPAVASMVACRLANAVAAEAGCAPAVAPDALARVPAAVAAAAARVDAQLAAMPDAHVASALLGRVAFVTAGALGGELTHGLRWKWLEGLGLGEPPAWDVLQVAHGPFQDFCTGSITLFGLLGGQPGDAALFERLARVLEPARHRLFTLSATLPGAAAAHFEHDAACNQLLLRALAAHPRDLANWPGKGLDGPLYDLGG